MSRLAALVLAAVCCCVGAAGSAVTSITQHGITWTFDQGVQTGTFVNGDHWVVGPVAITGIINTLNSPTFAPKRGQNGSMINPSGKAEQGYESGYQFRGTGYREELNAALPNGKPISRDNPLILKPEQSLVSAVSWLWRTADDREPGCPRIHVTKVPLPTLRSAAVLTCLAEAPPENSFRPPYCGSDKSVRYGKQSLQCSLLRKLKPVGPVPDIGKLEDAMSRLWLDHYPSWVGRSFHPSGNMPNYGRDLTKIMVDCALVLHLDLDQLEGNLSKDRILVNLVQYGIDLAGIADNGGEWPPDGGHGVGRKWPILFAGLMLNDAHMKNVGQWKTMFQEDAQTFYIDKKAVEVTNSAAWNPDRRTPVAPYTEADIGVPEWGIRHATDPTRDHRQWFAKYRAINNAVIPGFVLAARIMGQKQAWNHDALFDYADRVMETDGGQRKGYPSNSLSAFPAAMWEAYRERY